MMKKYIDIESWPRKKQFILYNKVDYPHFNICANMDITKTYSYIKKNDMSFSNTIIYLTAKVANSIKEFRYRICNDKVIEYDVVHPSFTVLTQSEVFSFCKVDYTDNFQEFIRDLENKVEKLKGKVDIESDENRDDVIFTTSMPWVSFTSVSHPIHMNPTDSIPRIGWGKYFKENENLKLPVSVQVNHALMDGIHVGKYFIELQEILDKPEQYI